MRSLHDLIDAELEFDLYDLPNPAWRRHTQAILVETVGRRMQTVGRLDEVQERVRPGCKDVQTEARIEKALQFITWDTRYPRIVHHERVCGTCANRDQAVQHVVSCLVECEIFPRPNLTVPAKHRFGSAMTCLAELTPGILISSLLPRVFRKAFPEWDCAVVLPLNDATAEDEDPQSREYVKRKAWRSRKVFEDPQRTLQFYGTLFALKPLEWFWARIQHIDAKGELLLEVMSRRSPIAHAQSELATSLAAGWHW